MSTKTITKIIVALVLIATVCLAVTTVFGTITIPDPGDGGITPGLKGSVARVLGVVKYICYAAAVILLVILGVKWIMAAPDQKADLKKSAVIYVVGAVLVFAAGAILQVIRSVANNTVKNGN
jgi:TRAP-type C4-dicarboxylate transport system permease small subunit